MTWLPWISLLVSLATPLVIFVGRNWLKARIEKGVQHHFDKQIEAVLPDLVQAIAIPRIVLLGNHAKGSGDLLKVFGRCRAVLAFPGIAGYPEGSTIRYLDIPQQHTVVQESAEDVQSIFREAGFRVDREAFSF